MIIDGSWMYHEYLFVCLFMISLYIYIVYYNLYIFVHREREIEMAKEIAEKTRI